jgi:hypothetical protein
MVSGVALLDYDGDGRLDVYAVNGAPIDGLRKTGPEYWNRLFHQDADGTFTDVTEKAGVAGRGYDLGVVTGDYDNDGDPDIFVAGLRRNTLFRNNGDGTFTDVTEAAGLAPSRSDLRHALGGGGGVRRLRPRRPARPLSSPTTACGTRRRSRSAATHPAPTIATPSNTRASRTRSSTTTATAPSPTCPRPSGIRAHVGKGMGIGAADFDGDGWVDLFVSNDTLPSSLFMNGRDGTFKESAFDRAVAFPDRARPCPGMGAAAGDVDNDGWPDVFQTALSNETFPLFRNVGKAMFEEITDAVRRRDGHTRAARGGETGSWTSTTTDGRTCSWPPPDVMDPKGSFGERVPMANVVLLNLKDGRFADGSAGAGGSFARKAVHRGAAFGDIDGDGRLDVVVSALDGPIELWRNVSPAHQHWLVVDPAGRRSNRDGLGTKIKLIANSGTQYGEVNTAVGYGCASDRRVHFGLGADTAVRELTLSWPSGKTQILTNVQADQILKVTEPN